MPLEAGRRLGPYEIVSAIGAGGMGEVYKARDTRLDRTVAIKVLPEHVASDPDLKQRFEREAKVKTCHPGQAKRKSRLKAPEGEESMVKQIALIALVLGLVPALPVSAQTDVTGTWNAVVELDAGSREPVFVLQQNGETLTGTYRGTFGSATITGTVTGDMIEFTFGAEGVGEARYTGKITQHAAGQTMEDTCDSGGRP